MNSPTISARPIRKADIPRIIELLPEEFESARMIDALFENPDLTRWPECNELPTGFVLEDNGEPVGYIDSIPREVYYRQTPFKAAMRGSFYVKEEYRVHLSTLLFAMIDQKWCDLIMINSSNKNSGPVNRALRFKAGPESCTLTHYRIFSFIGFLLYGTSKSERLRGIPAPIRSAGCYLLGGLLSLVGKFCRKRLPDERTRLETRRIHKITDEVFQPFWEELLEANPGFLTSRRPDVLRWTFQKSLDCGQKIMLGRFDGEKLRGEITLQIQATQDGFPRVRVIDWVAVGNDEAILGDLLRDAIRYVQDNRCGIVLQISGFPESVQPLISRYLPRSHARLNGFFYKVKNSEIVISPRDSWFFSLYDGDAARL